VSKGWKIAIGVVLFMFVSCGGFVAYISYKISQNPEVQNAFSAIGESAKVMAEAANAPGTKELRELGCTQAMAIDMKRMAEVGKRLDAKNPPAEVGSAVICEWRKSETPPTCDDAAKAYVRGALPKEKFSLSVQLRTGEQSCTGTYDETGALLHDGDAFGR
jgi:hypothetical protein